MVIFEKAPQTMIEEIIVKGRRIFTVSEALRDAMKWLLWAFETVDQKNSRLISVEFSSRSNIWKALSSFKKPKHLKEWKQEIISFGSWKPTDQN